MAYKTNLTQKLEIINLLKFQTILEDDNTLIKERFKQERSKKSEEDLPNKNVSRSQLSTLVMDKIKKNNEELLSIIDSFR